MTGDDQLTYQQAMRAARELGPDSPAHGTPLRIVLGGNANNDFAKPALRVQLAAEGFTADIRASAYGNWIAESFGADLGDVWVIWLSAMGASRGMTARPDHDLDAVASAATRLTEAGVKVVVIPPESLPVEDDPFSPFSAWRAGLVAGLVERLPVSVTILPVEHLVRRRGMDQWAATRYWEQAKAPCHPDAATAVGQELGNVIARLLRPAVRAVAVDLDDTLWGGLVGEVGPAGLALDPDGSGRPFLELQRFLLDLSERGIALGVVSKNEDAQARRPFAERPEMVLPLDTFVRFDASWGPKYEAIRSFAEQLNIGIDAVCFLDDSAIERDEAARLLPGLVVPDLAASPAKRVEQLIRSRLFLAPKVSDEDRLRVEFFKRAAAPVPEDLDGYLAGLEMTLEALPVDQQNLDRVVSLLHKTNQFNATLWRPSPAELTEFLATGTNLAYAYRLTDRLGDAGIIAVLLVGIDGDTAGVAGWVMSCRVFSRGVEWAIADHAARKLAERAVGSVEVPYAPGPRNGLVADVLVSLGLEPSADDGAIRRFRADTLVVPDHHVTIVER